MKAIKRLASRLVSVRFTLSRHSFQTSLIFCTFGAPLLANSFAGSTNRITLAKLSATQAKSLPLAGYIGSGSCSQLQSRCLVTAAASWRMSAGWAPSGADGVEAQPATNAVATKLAERNRLRTSCFLFSFLRFIEGHFVKGLVSFSGQNKVGAG